MQIGFRRYNWNEQFRNHGVAALIAARGSGKSTLLRQILYELRDRFDLAVAFCGSSDAARSMSSLCHPAFLYTCLDSEELTDRLEAIVDEQDRLASLGKPRRMCVLLEDLSDDRKFFRNNASLKRIASRGRHSYITLVATAQACHQLPPDVRTNLDTVVVLANKGQEREAIRKSFFSMLSSREYGNVVDSLCVSYRALVLDTTRQSSNLSDQLFFCKARPDLPPFCLLSPKFKAIADTIRLSAEDINQNEERLRRMRAAEREKRAKKRIGVQSKSVAVPVSPDLVLFHEEGGSSNSQGPGGQGALNSGRGKLAPPSRMISM